MLIATINGEHIGSGKIMLETILSVAKELGYEQAELEVIYDNNAIKMYKKLGFNEYGIFPDNMKYANGTQKYVLKQIHHEPYD